MYILPVGGNMFAIGNMYVLQVLCTERRRFEEVLRKYLINQNDVFVSAIPKHKKPALLQTEDCLGVHHHNR